MMSVAEIPAVICVALTNVVVRGLPSHFTTELLRKFVPFTVRVNAVPPATALLGTRPLIVGAGLLTAETLKETAALVPPPGSGLIAVTCTVPAAAMSEEVIAAVICVPLTRVVVRALPFQFTVVFALKFVPVAFSVSAVPPAVALVGEIELSVGTGFGWTALPPSQPLLHAAKNKTQDVTNTLPHNPGNDLIFLLLLFSGIHVCGRLIVGWNGAARGLPPAPSPRLTTASGGSPGWPVSPIPRAR
jgi:hypothetical protein